MNLAIPNAPPNRSPSAARAGGSSFYFAMRILPRERREAMFEIYSFCRAVDDIADGDEPHPLRLSRLAGWRQDIEALYTGRVPRGLEALAATVERFALRKDDFLAVIDGMEMDATEDIRAPDLEKLELYCDRVACAVGRLSVRIFGMEDGEGRSLAHHLGRALQMTNILRDIDEDAGMGRLYLPREGLQRAGIDATEPKIAVANPSLGVACTFLAELARDHFAKADAIMSGCARRVVRAPKIMSKVYRQMLEDMIARGWSQPRQRVHVNKSHLLWIALRYAFL